TTVPPPEGASQATLTSLDCAGERVTITNTAAAAIDLTGWSIHDEGTKHTFNFPAGYRLDAGASVTVRSGGPAEPGELAWTGASVWNNDGDTAYLVTPAGAVASTRSC
ncbi:MAG: lamin tail domain-containing protein, partial [Candidatus Methylomirabilales bacterium]